MLKHLEGLTSEWVSLSMILLYLGVILIIAEGLNRFAHAQGELTRKVVHIGAGNVILLAWWLNIPAWIGIAASVIAGAIACLSYFLPILPSVNSVGRRSLGTFFYAISIGVLIAWFWHIHQPQYAAIGILVMTWGDGLAAIIGQNWGKHPYQFMGNKKSWEGSLTMMLVSFLVTSLILVGTEGNIWQNWVIALAVALVATNLETVSQLGIDNLTVPLGSTALCFFLTHII